MSMSQYNDIDKIKTYYWFLTFIQIVCLVANLLNERNWFLKFKKCRSFRLYLLGFCIHK